MSWEAAKILKGLNYDSGQLIKKFLAGAITEEGLKEGYAEIAQRYYDALVKKEVIAPSGKAHIIIAKERKGTWLATEEAIKCKAGEITWEELVANCSAKVIPLIRKEVSELKD